MTQESIYQSNAAGMMQLAGHDVKDLLTRFGSPLIVMLEDVIRENCRAYRKQIEQYPRSRVYYASKAFLTTGFCRLIEQEKLYLDVVSLGELKTALAANFPPEKILMHGNAKTIEDLEFALRAGVGRIVIDNLEEIDKLAQLTKSLDTTVHVPILSANQAISGPHWL